MHTLLIAEMLGFLAFFLALIGFSLKKPKHVLCFLCLPCALWVGHFALLAQFSGMATSAIALIRNVIGAVAGEKIVHKANFSLFILLTVIVLPSINMVADLLPLCAALAGSLAVYLRDRPFLFRLSCLSGHACWVAYGIAFSSAALVVSGVIMGFSIFISIIRYDLKVRLFNNSLPAHKIT